MGNNSYAPPTLPPPPTDTEGGQTDTRNWGQKALDFAFPIIGDIANDTTPNAPKKTLLQQAGDLGLSGLWFVPGLGEADNFNLKSWFNDNKKKEGS